MKEADSNLEEGNNIKTAVDVAIFNDKEEVLLGRRLAKAGFATWGFPGGHLRTGEKIMDGASRELSEELGKEAKIKIGNNILSVRENSIEPNFIHHVTIIIQGKYLGGNIKINEPDSCDKWSWFKLNSLPDKLFSGVKETLENYSQQKTTIVTDWR